MLKKSTLKQKKLYTLKRKPLGQGKNYKGLAQTSQLKTTHSELKKTELNKQNEKAKQKWEEVHQKVLQRDNNKCIICKKPATQVHHIHLRSKRKDLMYSENNLVSLCDKCHNHQSLDGLEQVNRKIALVKHMTLEELLAFAERIEND